MFEAIMALLQQMHTQELDYLHNLYLKVPIR